MIPVAVECVDIVWNGWPNGTPEVFMKHGDVAGELAGKFGVGKVSFTAR